MTHCRRTLEGIEKEVEALRGSSSVRRFGAFLKDPGKIKSMVRRLDEVVNLFKVSAHAPFRICTGGNIYPTFSSKVRYGDWSQGTYRRSKWETRR